MIACKVREFTVSCVSLWLKNRVLLRNVIFSLSHFGSFFFGVDNVWEAESSLTTNGWEMLGSLKRILLVFCGVIVSTVSLLVVARFGSKRIILVFPGVVFSTVSWSVFNAFWVCVKPVVWNVTLLSGFRLYNLLDYNGDFLFLKGQAAICWSFRWPEAQLFLVWNRQNSQ